MKKVGGPGAQRPARVGQMRKAVPAVPASSEGTARLVGLGACARSAAHDGWPDSQIPVAL